MGSGAVGKSPFYWAFISYSHKDARFGRWLHHRLETYSLPQRLVGTQTQQGELPARLVPIFRDRDEFAAAGDLSAEVRAALQISKALIVVCSPSAAASRWVSKEVETFRDLHPDRPILAALVGGNPDESFPTSLRQQTGGLLVEPLAADFRPEGDGRRTAVLKLVAGITGLHLDSLIQRDAQRHMRRVTAVTAAACAGMIAMGALSAYALNAKIEAERQRLAAEGLIEFMLTDLRTKLKSVGRLDAMLVVNQRALRYYNDSALDELPVDSLERRARVLHAMGEDDEARGAWAAATAKFEEARRTTAALLSKAPKDPARIFDHAQSEFWMGEVAYEQGYYGKAKLGFTAYQSLAKRLLAIDPHSPKYLREAGYADGNLCMLALKPPKDAGLALQLCSSALSYMQEAAKRLPNTPDVLNDLANRHAWLADAYRAAGNRKECVHQRRIQEQIFENLMAHDPKNMRFKENWISLQRILAWLDYEGGDKDAALSRLHRAAAVSDRLVAFDPANKSWAKQRTSVDSDISEILNETSRSQDNER